MNLRPILGAKIDVEAGQLEQLRYPMLASFKLDGIRALRYGPEFISRTLKTIPNRNLAHIFRQFELKYGISLNGYDGELIFGDPTHPRVFNRTDSCVMSQYAPAEQVRFFVFDNYEEIDGFKERHEALREHLPLVVKVEHFLVNSPAEVLMLEDQALEKGYEGLILRAPNGPYKYGRSTFREQYLLKLKRFHDDEAKIIGFEERLHNANTATVDARGYTKRSSHQDGKVPTDTLGALVVDWKGRELRIGTGFTERQRVVFWQKRDSLYGELVTFKYLPIGVKDLPRHPVFKGFRNPIDVD